MKAIIQFDSEISANNLESLRNYLKSYNFHFEKTSEGGSFFKKKGLLAGWYTNPLNFQSHLDFKLLENKCKATFEIDSQSNIFTKEAQECWEVFMEDIARVLNGHEPQKNLVHQAITKAKKSIQFSHIYVVLGLLLGGGAGKLMHIFIGSHYFVYMGLLIGSVIGFKWNSVNQTVCKNYEF